MDKKIFKEGIALLLRAFPNKEINPKLAWVLLCDLNNPEYESAIMKIISTQVEIYPNTNMIALIRHNAKEDLNILTAGEAWGKVLRQISKAGHYGIPKFKDDLVKKSVEAIGWHNICMSENIGIERAHFFKVYEALSGRKKQKDLLLPNIPRENPLCKL